ncbi:MAG: hypothetical protein ACFBZ8_03725 [Opitutales bacterium]
MRCFKRLSLWALCLFLWFGAIINLGLVIQFNQRRVLPFGDPENPGPAIAGIFLGMVLCAFSAFFLVIHLVRSRSRRRR